ncbi:MAG: Plug domain-containing protein [Gemmatimonadales bacterium]
MTPRVASLLAGALCIAAATRAAAQAEADTTARRDTTTAADTAAADTLPAFLPTFAAPIRPGPLPLGSRYTFTADSLLFTNARTLSDLLRHIPGVYVVRGGGYGQAEVVLYGGRGPAALEVFWDGFPYVPLGRDSVYLDPARIPLAPLERVDVVILPAQLQVYLVSARTRSTAPLTQVGIVTGDQDIAEYRGGYAKRTRSGFGIAFLYDQNSIRGSEANTTSEFTTADIAITAEYIPPGGRVGASFQMLTASWSREPTADARVIGWKQQRRERRLRFFVAERSDGLGYRLEGTLATSEADGDSLVPNRMVSGAVLAVSRTWRRANLVASAQLGAAGLPSEFAARAGWLPVSWLTLAASARHRAYGGGRSGQRAHVTAGLALPFGFSARAELAWRRDVQAPLVRTDGRQAAVDVAGWLRFDQPWLQVEVGRGIRDPFTPLDFARGISTVDRLSPTPRTEFLAGHATLRPLPGVSLSAWHFDPFVGGGDFEPPHQTRVAATFHSKFWRVFRSGVFTLRGEVAIESWSSWGLGGLDSAGVRRSLNGATFVETTLELQLVGATIFWIIRNVNGMRGSYVYGLGYPKNTQLYGARWYFTN